MAGKAPNFTVTVFPPSDGDCELECVPESTNQENCAFTFIHLCPESLSGRSSVNSEGSTRGSKEDLLDKDSKEPSKLIEVRNNEADLCCKNIPIARPDHQRRSLGEIEDTKFYEFRNPVGPNIVFHNASLEDSPGIREWHAQQENNEDEEIIKLTSKMGTPGSETVSLISKLEQRTGENQKETFCTQQEQYKSLDELTVVTPGNLRELGTKSIADTGSEENMTSPRSKSPRPVTPKKDDKDESFWDKLGTLGRKKRIKEVQEFEQEGKNAIDSPGSPTQFDIAPEDYDLGEGEERSLIERRSYADPKLQHLIGLLIDWINDELADQRIIVKSIEDDLYDGQILQKLLEKLTGQKLEIPEVSQSEEGQRHKLEVVLNAATHAMGLPRWNPQKWSVEAIHSKSLVAILYLLVTLARHFRAPLRLPENVSVETVVVRKKGGKLDYRRVVEEITSTYDEFGMRCERDAFDTLLDNAPDKLQVVKNSLIIFVNKHLNKINLEVTDFDTQFHDGVYLTLLMGLLEGYFVPLFEFHVTPKDFEQKVFNVSFAFELMQDAGINKPKARPEDIVNLDLKSTLRVLYNLFAKYRHVN